MNVKCVKTICYVWYIRSILGCLITVDSNPISAPNSDPLRSRENVFIIDTNHLKLVR